MLEGTPFIKVKNTGRHGSAPRGTSTECGLEGLRQCRPLPFCSLQYQRPFAGTELDYRDFYVRRHAVVRSIPAPPKGSQLGERVYSSNGKRRTCSAWWMPRSNRCSRDEFILGFKRPWLANGRLASKLIHRKLRSGMDDICNDEGPSQWAAANGYTEDQHAAIGEADRSLLPLQPGAGLDSEYRHQR